MSKSQLVITALFVEHQSPAEVAERYGVHRAWVYQLKARYEAEGEAALTPRSRRPTSSPSATPPAAVELVLRLRKQLAEAGLDAGADTIGWHLARHHRTTLSRATINRILVRAGAVVPEPAKRPKSSYIRFAAEQPNECWQSDFTHYRLTHLDGTPGAESEILSWLDDCTRYALSVTDTHDRVRHDKIDDGGAVTLRVNGRLHHIGVGRTHARTPVILLVQDLAVRIVNATTGELLRELTIDPRRDYQPTGRPPGPAQHRK